MGGLIGQGNVEMFADAGQGIAFFLEACVLKLGLAAFPFAARGFCPG